MGERMVKWCGEVGRVVGNEEVVEGVWEGGGLGVVEKKMGEWCVGVCG